MDQEFLSKFADHRYKHFSYGKLLSPHRYFYRRKEQKYFEDLERKIELKEADTFDQLLYWIFNMVEVIHRVDFASKYYFHTLTPKARNHPSIRVAVIHHNTMYSFCPLTNKIIINKNDLMKGNPSETYILLFSDDSKTQFLYGEFHMMLSALNVGHAMFNIEYAMQQIDVSYEYFSELLMTAEMTDFFRSNYITVPIVMKVNLNGYSVTETVSHNQRYVNQSVFPHKLTNIGKIMKLFTISDFRARSSNQVKSGDVIFNKSLSEGQFTSLIYYLKECINNTSLELYFYINDVENLKKGYYCLNKKGINFIEPGSCCLEYRNILKEYHEYINFTGINFWCFMNITDYRDIKNIKFDFHTMGMIAQFLSTYMAKIGYASRCLKNYNDQYIKLKVGLGSNDLIGYSVVAFPNRGEVGSLYIEGYKNS